MRTVDPELLEFPSRSGGIAKEDVVQLSLWSRYS